MSVWKRFQRVGKKAAKYQFTSSYTELLMETNNFKPGKLVITWFRRNRKYPSEPMTLIDVPLKPNCYSFVWEVPKNEEIQTTLYKMKKDIEFEDKDWTFQLEDIGSKGTHRRLLAYRNINISQYAHAVPSQEDIKIVFKISSKKVKSATLFLTLSSVFLKEGEATDEDMISVASLMSLPSSQNFLSLPNDIAVLTDLEDIETNHSESNISDKINELCDQIGNEDWDKDNKTERVPEHKDSSPKKSVQDFHTNTSYSISKSISIKTDFKDDQLFSIAEDDISGNFESNSTTDLLEWCQSITKSYKDVKVTNFTTSFRNGMAFCAIVHHFHPDLINMDSLKSSNVSENNRIAFSAAASLGIPRVLDANEMSFLKVPDSLSVMTYLHQLKTHFTDNNLVITPASIGNNYPSSYSKQTSPSLSASPIDIKNMINTDTSSLKESSDPKQTSQIQDTHEFTFESPNTSKKDTKNLFEFDSVKLSEESEKIPDYDTEPKPDIIDPVEKTTKNNKSPKKPKKLLSSFNVDGTVKDKCPLSEKKIKPLSLGTLNMFTESELKENHGTITTNAIATGGTSSKALQSNGHSISSRFNKLSSITAQNADPSGDYIAMETKDLEREQERIDDEACRLEKQIRIAMESKDKKGDPILMEKWFQLVNKKNALIRRNMKLQILEKEQNLERKWNLLQEELREILSVEDFIKTEEMRKREDLLMKDLINIINQRDNVVNELDKYEQGNATEMEWARKDQESYLNNSAFTKAIASAKFNDKSCIIQ